MIPLEEVEQALREGAYQMGVLILSWDHLRYRVADWSRLGESRGGAVALVERWTTAEAFRALEFAEWTAKRLDVPLIWKATWHASDRRYPPPHPLEQIPIWPGVTLDE